MVGPSRREGRAARVVPAVAIMPERFPFEVDGVRIGATAYSPSRSHKLTFLLGPGSDGHQSNPLIVDFATGLAERGVLVVTYDFPFAAAGRSRRDKDEVLERCCRAAVTAARQCRPGNQMFVGGKSLGASIAARVLAEGDRELDGILGVVALGFSLHALGGRSPLSRAELLALEVPVLFVQGTRDPFGTAEELRTVATSLPPGTEIITVEGGDHELAVPARNRPPAARVHAALQDGIVRWMDQVSQRGRPSGRGTRPARVTARLGDRLRTFRSQRP